MGEAATKPRDRQQVFFERFDRRIRDELKPLVTDAIIEEHRRKPSGRHSDALDRLLNYFRRAGIADKYAILAVRPFAEYRVVRLSGRRGVRPTPVGDETYASPDEAYHAVFLKRIQALLDS